MPQGRHAVCAGAVGRICSVRGRLVAGGGGLRALSSARSARAGPDPTIIQTAPQPDYFFLWLYAALAFLPPAIETPLLLIAPVIGDRASCSRCRSMPASARRAGIAGRWRCCLVLVLAVRSGC